MTLTEQKIIESINQVLEQEIMLENGDDLKGEGLDSMATVELVIELEDVFGIQFNDKDMIVDNFKTINQIVETLNQYGVSNE